MEELASLKNKTALDVGTGTGILSLASILLGARSSVAFDIDGDAVRTCGRNADINQVSDRLRIFRGTIEALEPSAGFDIVLANIHGDIILREARRLAEHTKEEGHLILSGLDYSDNRPVRTILAGEGMNAVNVRFLEEFVTQVWRRPSGMLRKEP